MRFSKILVLSFLLTISVESAYAQTTGQLKTLHAKEAIDPIKLDGILDEASWQDAEMGVDFWQYWPSDSIRAKTTTEVKITYDENFIYVGAKLYHYNKKKYIINSLSRDFQGPEIDGFHVNFDTYYDNTNAFNFAINPSGAQREGTIADGGNGSIDVSWDNKWFSEVTVTDDYWIAEMAIPFKTIRYKEGSTVWGFNSFRLDGNANERVIWTSIPQGFSMSSLAFDGELIFDKPLKKPGPNISLIPYLAGGTSKDYEGKTPRDNNLAIGGDAKIGVTPGLNLDLTVNPDFSQVEVDRQQTNISRFELFFPEKRQFFLENNDLFSNYGGETSRPFFSRRIGITQDTATGQNIQNTIHAGARLSGKLDKNWRIGLLTMQAAADDKNGLPSINYGMTVLQRKVMTNSTISAFMVNKEAVFNDSEKDYDVSLDHYNRVIGSEFNYRSINGRFRSTAYYHRSFTEQDTLNKEFTSGILVNYLTRRFSILTQFNEVGKNYTAEVGFVPRLDFKRSFTQAKLNFYPQTNGISSHGATVEYEQIWNSDRSRTDQMASIGYDINFRNLARFSLMGTIDYTFLLANFDPARKSNGVFLAAGTDYTYKRITWGYSSNTRKTVFYNFNGSVGEFFNGKIFNLNGNINYRIRPIFNFSVDYNYNRLRLPEPFNDADLFLIGPKFEFTFTRNLFFTTLIQYNNQLENVNLNARFQWRYKPVSDFFLVYTDNYYTSPVFLGARNRAIVFKWTYWLNL
ncbi:MAG TPA: hydrolase [Cytophagales bacterium]|nr:hydrolase [Cytophagales bacterium]